MGLLDDIIKEAKDTAKSELRNEVRSSTRDAVRGAIQGAKKQVSKASDEIKEELSAKQENPAVTSTVPVETPAQPTTSTVPAEPSPQPTATSTQPVAETPVHPAADNIGDAMANSIETVQPAVQAINSVLNDDGALGKLANAFIGTKMTEQEKAEMKEGLAAVSDPGKVAEMKDALHENPDQIEAKLREEGVDPEQLTAQINQGMTTAAQQMPKPETNGVNNSQQGQ